MTKSIQRLPSSLLAQALSYVPHPDTALVTKLFCAATKKAMQAEWYKGAGISNRHFHYSDERLLAKGQEREDLRKEIKSKLDRHFPLPPNLGAAWDRYIYVSNASIDLLDTEDQLFSEQHPQIYGKMLERWTDHFREKSALFDEEPVNFLALADRIRQFIGQEGLVFRARKVAMLPGHDPENPDQIMRCFAKLHEEESALVCRTWKGRQALAHIPLNYSQGVLTRIERLISVVDGEIESNLFLTWQYIRAQLGAVLPPGAPARAAAAWDIRTWMNDPANQLLLDRVENLHIPETVTAVPPEITSLRKLVVLSLTTREIPSFLAECRYLHTINHSGKSLHALPDPLYRHLESTFYIFERWWWHSNCSLNKADRIPFRMWFKEHLLIPHFLPFQALDRELSGWSCIREIRGNRLFDAILVPYQLLGFLLEGLINLPIFLINLFLIDVVEPIVTLIRDQLKMSRMVRVR